MINGLERYEIRWISPAKNEDIAAFGVYQSGAIQEGHFERLTVVEAGTEAKWVADLARGGRIKGFILSGVAAVLAFFAGLCAFLATKKSQKAATA